jgi:uncharacterized protein YhdP
MKQFLRNLSIITAYAFATLLILMAVIVGLFRLFLPRLPEYQEEIKGWAGNAIGMEVEFSGMNARWALSGPELEFYDAELIRRDSQKRMLSAERVSVGVSVSKLLFDRSFVVDRVLIRDTDVEIRQLEDGGWWIQGSPLEELLGERGDGPPRSVEIDIVGEDVVVQFLQPGDEQPIDLAVRRVVASIDENRIAIDAVGRLPAELGRQVDLSATHLLGRPTEDRGWDIRIEGEDIDLSGWSRLQQFPARAFLSGDGDLEVSLAWSGGKVTNAAGILSFQNIATIEDEAFDLAGRFEVDLAEDGWFFEVEDFSVATGDTKWPDTTVRVETSVDPSGELVVLAVDATYVNLDDASLLLPWLPDDRQQQLLELDLAGVVRDLNLTVYNLSDDAPSFDIDTDLVGFGIAPIGKIPGVRGFTGSIFHSTSTRLPARSPGAATQAEHWSLPTG